MKAAINGVLGLLWMAIGYTGLLFCAKRYFTGRYRAETAAGAVVLAFALGFGFPRGQPTAPAPVAAYVPAPALVSASAAADVSAACAKARLTTTGGKGSADSAAIQTSSGERVAGRDAPLRKGERLVVRGWSALPDLKVPSTGACMVLDGKIAPGATVTYGGNRPDVAAAMNNPALLATAFQIVLPASMVSVGRHRIEVAAVASDGSATLLPGNFSVNAVR